MWIGTACGMSFEVVPGRPCANMQGDLGLERRLCDELLLNLETSPMLLWKDYYSGLLHAPSALNVDRCLLITLSLLRLEGWTSSQMRRLRRLILWVTEGTAATCLLRERTRVLALCQKRNIQYLSCRSVSLHPMAPLIWFPSGYRLTARDCEVKLADKLVPWINNTFDMSSVTVVLQQDEVPAHSSNRVQHFLQEQIFCFWSRNMWPPFSPDTNPLDYAFWLHIEARACNVRHINITAFRTSVDREWMVMSRDYVIKNCNAFRHRLEGIIASDGGYIE